MQDPLRILVVYSDPTDPIVTLLTNQQNGLHHEITLVSVKDFIEKIEVHDKLDTNGVTIEWVLSNQDGTTKVWSNQHTFLINRCYDLWEPCHRLFHPDDREYAENELTAYLNFAFNSFKYRLQPVSYYGLSGSTMPLFIQWDTVKERMVGLKVPNYYVGPYYLLEWSKAIINPDPYDVTYWRAEHVAHDNVRTDYIFAYERPIGQPVFVYITPIGADLIKSEALNKTELDEALLKHLATDVGKNLGISLGEVLFFASEQQITFGAATPHIINAKNIPNFRELTLKALTTTLSYDTRDHFRSTNNTQRAPGNLIVIGSNQDRTTNNLAFSHSFHNEGILLSFEEFTTNWNFTYANSHLTFYTRDTTIDSIGAIYYRPFNQQESINDSLELLNSCLDSFNGLVYGRSKSQYLNSSKPLQLVHSIPIITHHHAITFPNTIIIKSNHNKEVISPPKGTKYIAKSISSIRSIVVNNETFATWKKDGLNALPALFQRQIEGDDVRVHVCHSQVIAVKISNKDVVDYRYSDTSSFQEVTIPQEIIDFCLTISRVEQNPLIGIDLIQTTEGYVFLESNPMPGWDYFFKQDKSKEKVCGTIMGR